MVSIKGLNLLYDALSIFEHVRHRKYNMERKSFEYDEDQRVCIECIFNKAWKQLSKQTSTLF